MKYNWFKPLNFKKELSKSIINTVNQNKMTMGNKTIELEKKIKKFLNVKHVVLTTSGTSALMMASLALKIVPNDVVISSNLTWVATTNPSKILGANIHLVDTEKHSEKVSFKELNKKIKELKPKMVLLVHLNGQPTYNEEFEELKSKYKFFVIEDAAQALLSKTDAGIPCGTHYDIGCFSLSMTKPVNMVYGGFCSTNSSELAEKLITIWNNGLCSQEWHLKRELASDVGLNLKPSDLHSSIGIINLKAKNLITEKLINIYDYYKKNLANPKLSLVKVKGKFSVPCYPQVLTDNRDKLISYCLKKKIALHPGLRCLSESQPLKNNEKIFPNSIYMSQNIARLPSGPGYSLEEISKITDILNNY